MSKTSDLFTTPLHSTPSDDNTYHFFAEKASVLVRGKDTNGKYCVVEITEPPHEGPPLHIHEHDEETFFVLKGEVTFYIGDKVIHAKEGDFIRAPKGIPHRFKAGATELKMVVTAYPSGFDSFVEELGIKVPKDAPLPEVKPPTPEEINYLLEIGKRYNLTFPNLKKQAL